MTTATRRSIGIMYGIGITLLVTGLYVLAAVPAAAQDTPQTPAAQQQASPTPVGIYNLEGKRIEPTGDNSYCLVCHSRPWKTVQLKDGSIQNLYVNPATIAASVHGTSNPLGALGCVDCHGADSFPHTGPLPESKRISTLDSVQHCVSCHTENAEELQHGLHEAAILRGNLNAAVCTDCHGAHDVQPVAEERNLVAGVCGTCHVSTLTEWQNSAHVDIGPLGCATCHSPHSQRIRAGDTADELCLNCHKTMPDLWVHQQHASSDYRVGCTDCHMFVPEEQRSETLGLTTAIINAPSGHSMTLTSAPCTTCHEELMVSGEWSRLSGEGEAIRIERDRLAQQLAELQAARAAEPAAQEPNFVPLAQGLILGLGFGVTFAAVFITRGNNRPAAPKSDAPSPQPEPAASAERAAPEPQSDEPAAPDNPPAASKQVPATEEEEEDRS